MKTHDGSTDDFDVYSRDYRLKKNICLILLNYCRCLICADSLEHYNIRLINTVQNWSPAFQQYYMNNINIDV